MWKSCTPVCPWPSISALTGERIVLNSTGRLSLEVGGQFRLAGIPIPKKAYFASSSSSSSPTRMALLVRSYPRVCRTGSSISSMVGLSLLPFLWQSDTFQGVRSVALFWRVHSRFVAIQNGLPESPILQPCTMYVHFHQACIISSHFGEILCEGCC
jgi:hypothetical protein